MKKIKLILAGFSALILFTVNVQAQTTLPPPPAGAAAAPTSFVGKWDVLAKGLPNGDTHLFFTITNTDGKLGGVLQDPETKKDNPLTKVEQDDKGITLYFSAQGYDVTVTLQKITDDDHVKGSLMGMFECTGERVKADAGK